MLETLIDIWSEELVAEGHIERENFSMLKIQTIDSNEALHIIRYVSL